MPFVFLCFTIFPYKILKYRIEILHRTVAGRNSKLSLPESRVDYLQEILQETNEKQADLHGVGAAVVVIDAFDAEIR